LCKNSDVHFKQTFETEWAKLVNYVPEKHRDSVWLRDYIYSTHTKWCFAWTWSSVTLGVHSTQRCESIHAVIRQLLSNNSTLIDVIIKLEEWVRTKKMQAQTSLYMECVKFSTGNTFRQSRLISCMNKTFHDHAIKIVTANMHRSLEFGVQDVVNSQNVPTGMYTVQAAQENSSIQKDFFGPVQWVDNFLDQNPQYDEANTSDIHRLDRAVSVHDFFPLFRNVYLSDGEKCSCQYPQMQGLPCEHCFAVLLIKKQAKVMPDIFLTNTCWHIQSEETESQFHNWCKQLLSMKDAVPQPKIPNSTARSRYNGLMLTAKTMVSGYSLTVTDTEWLEDQMVEMCLGLKERHETKTKQDVKTLESGALRKCSACSLTGHRADNPKLCKEHRDFKPSTVEIVAPLSFVTRPLQIGSLPPQNPVPSAPPVVQHDAQSGPAQAVAAAVADETAAGGVAAAVTDPAVAEAVVQPALIFGSPVSLDAFSETYDEFDARLRQSHLYPRPVPGTGACFWSACLFGMQWLAKRNTIWATATRIPATAMEMRQKVLDFMHTNLQTNWSLNELSFVSTFEDSILAELPFGVHCGLTGVTLRPASITSWFEALRKEFSYTSLCCVQATALCFGLVIKVFIQGSHAVEQYVTRDSLLQAPEIAATVDPDMCVCLCKRDRAGHFDSCEWVAPKVYAPNPATKKGRGKAKQKRHKSSTELYGKKPKKAKIVSQSKT
jgi:hypothetical protein